ncbi:protocadherin Fat 4-like [Ptychodera flava]|uniref:protocadherin Fat 4-like n=1 Tax=Ptychodera flava TaxID=63121 RepID=UPI00396A90D9
MAIYGHKMVPARRISQVFVIILLRFLTLAVAEDDLQNGRAVERVFFSVDEGQPPGIYVGTVPIRPGFTYSFSTDPQIFRIDSNDGTIQTTVNIDREELDEDDLNYVVLGVSVTGSQPTYPIEVRITVVDVNDNSPSFPEPTISISFSETARIGAQYILDTATDPDVGTNGITENYAIAGGNTDNLFRLVVTPNPSGAAAFLHVETVGRLDRETQDFYQLNVTATDGGNPPLLGYILVNITIRDANDNPPIFDQSEYDVSLNESTPADTLVMRVRATDRDDGENAEVIYFLDEGEDLFTIHPQTGEIRTLRTLDFESNGVYTITVEAQDKGNPTQFGRAFVHISLVDENDHSPTVTFRFIPSSATFATVDEDAAIGSIVAIATVTDADEGLFGQAYLRIEAGNEQGHFRLYPLANLYAVQVAAKLDRERISQYNLTFIGQDFGSPPRTTVKHLIIHVTDANDHAPEFDQEVYTASLSELSPVGSFVKSLSATDGDSGLNAQIKYQITDGNDLSWFEIDENTGLVTTTAKLDQEFISEITLNVTAHDQGKVQRHAQTHLVITILDENDQAPTFSFTSYNVTIPENERPNREITIVSATDTDLGVNGTVFYKLEEHVDIDYPGVFSIDSQSGKIVTLISFDRETLSQYTVTVRAFDGGDPPQFSLAEVNVKVIDLNDNFPQFYPINYYADVLENEEAGTSVSRVSASDPDFGSYGIIQYSIVQDTSNGKFSVDSSSGVVRTTTSLDREEQYSYELTVQAQDGGNKVSPTAAVVHITVTDIQDTPPQFSESVYRFEIFENVDLGHYVGSVSATTRDPSTSVTYAISSGDRNGVFQIVEATGEIRTAKPIDREEQSFYQLTVIANGGPVIGHTLVNLTILDLNDNDPQFSRDSIITDVVESWEVGHNVYKVVATDSDGGPNAEIVYELITNPGEVFRIDAQTGQITLDKTISGQTRAYFLQVLATDMGTPHRSSVLNITVQVRDVNDHAPVFVQSQYATEIHESTELNSQFYQVSATDDDIGENGLVSYTITQGNGANKFGVFPDGSLYLKNYLDRELMDVYVLTITASDNGVPQRSSSVPVTITVMDDNDNRPLFANQTYYLHLQEELPPNTYVGIVIASDRDIGTNAELTYTLSSGQSDFTINPQTGEISSLRTFDREQLVREGKPTVFELDAVVHDNGQHRLEDNAHIYIYITDVNDNHPQFFSDVYTASISETATTNTPVVHVAAHDEDSGTNSQITYRISSGNTEEKFQINTFTGQITLNGMLDRETVSEYTLTVSAEDQGTPEPPLQK